MPDAFVGSLRPGRPLAALLSAALQDRPPGLDSCESPGASGQVAIVESTGGGMKAR